MKQQSKYRCAIVSTPKKDYTVTVPINWTLANLTHVLVHSTFVHFQTLGGNLVVIFPDNVSSVEMLGNTELDNESMDEYIQKGGAMFDQQTAQTVNKNEVH